MVERRHRTIRELGVTMIFHSGVPNFLLVEAFTTTTFSINRLPLSSINFNSPYFRLYGIHPNYSILRMFGPRCYPYTWDTKKNKFIPKTIICVFLGYSYKHKGYQCFDPQTRRMFVSRHVMFDENMFPYKTKESLSPSNVCITYFLDSSLLTPMSQTSPSTTTNLTQIPISIMPEYNNSNVPPESPSNHDNDHTLRHDTLNFSSQDHDMTSLTSHTIVGNNSVSENSNHSSHLSE